MNFKSKIIIPYFLLFILSILYTFVFLKYDFVFKYELVSLFSGFLFLVFLSQVSSKLLKIFLILSLLISLFIYPVLVMYGYPDNNLVASVYYTNREEVFSYSKSVPFKVFLNLGLLVVYTIVMLRLKYQKFNVKGIKLILLISLLMIPVKKIFTKDFHQKGAEVYFDSTTLRNVVYFIREYSKIDRENKFIEKESKKPSEWEVNKTDNDKEPDIFVLVIGESVRKDFMNAYGFHLDNTPFISSSNRIQFNNYLSVASKTIFSLNRTITLVSEFPKYQSNNNIVNLANKIGYETWWLSNQGQIGLYDSPTTIIARNSDYQFFLRKGEANGENQDSELLPLFENSLNKNSNHKKFIVLHTIGSHPSSCSRTDGKYDEFFLSEDISCYVQSIKNTDSLLKEIYNDLIKTKKTFKMVYFSDHGLKITDDLTMIHGKNIKESYDVPLIIWGNDVQEKKFINAQRSGVGFLKLFSELTAVNVENLPQGYKFLSDENIGSQNELIVDSKDEKNDYSKMSSNKLSSFINE